MRSSFQAFLANSFQIILTMSLVAGVTFIYGFSPIGDENDIWWHLKTGKIILEGHGLPPKYDVFAYTSADREWHNHEWLTQIGMYGAYQAFEDRVLGGMRGVILAKALVLVAAFLMVWLLAAQRSGDFAVAAIVTILAISVSRFSIKARPPVITYLFLPMALMIFYNLQWRYERVFRRWFLFLLLGIVTILWANMHGGFILAILVAGCFALGTLIDGLAEWLMAGRAGRWWRHSSVAIAWAFALTALGLFLASLVNPYGFKLYGMYLRVMGDSELIGAISEMQPPDLRFTRDFLFMTAALIVFGSLARRQLPTATDYLLLVFFFQQSTAHVRHLPLFAIIAAPILAWQVRSFYDQLHPKWRLRWPTITTGLAVVVAAWAVLAPRPGWVQSGGAGPGERPRAQSALQRSMALWNGPAYDPVGYPESICDELLIRDYPGRIFNEVYFAGYLIWRLSPERYQVFTDSRFDIFGGDFQRLAWIIQNGRQAEGDQPGWSDLLDRYGVNIVIIDRYKPLNERLEDSGQWKIQMRDGRDYFRLWIRNDPLRLRPLP